jgi:hypothetical protein
VCSFVHVRRVRQQDEAGHPRFKNQGVPAVEAEPDPLAVPLQSRDAPTYDTSPHGRRAWRNLDRLETAAHPFGVDDFAADDTDDAAPHRFDFRKLWHGPSGQWTGKWGTERCYALRYFPVQHFSVQGGVTRMVTIDDRRRILCQVANCSMYSFFLEGFYPT